MRNKNVVTVTSQKLTVKGNRLFRKTVQRIKKIKTVSEMKQFEKWVLGIDDPETKRIIILAVVTIRVIKAKLAIPKKQYDFLAQSVAMQSAQSENDLSYFTPPFLGMKEWNTNNGALSDALVALKNKTIGAAGMKKTAMTNLKLTLNNALGYINTLISKQQNIAESIIEAALMEAIGGGSRVQSDITVTFGTEAASIKVKCPAAKIDGKRVTAVYEKGYSTDGGTTWTDLPSLPKCSIIATGLKTGTPHIFRSRVTTTKEGTSAWVVSKPITPQ